MVKQDLTCQDPCQAQKTFSMARFAVFTLSFIAMWSGALFLIVFADRPYGIQLSTIVVDTAGVALYTFSRNRNANQPFLFSCPVVRRQLPRLIRRHLMFLAALFLLQTITLELRPKLPAYWMTPGSRDPSPLAFVLGGVCACLALAQILTNRSLLERAHVSTE